MVPHSAMTRISIKRCFLLRVSRRGSGRSWKWLRIEAGAGRDTQGTPFGVDRRRPVRGPSGRGSQRRRNHLAPPGQITQHSAMAPGGHADPDTSDCPTYLQAIFLASLAPRPDLARDRATGIGRAAILLSPFFRIPARLDVYQ